jgi:hypothetical protein
MQLELTTEDARFLHEHLVRHLRSLEDELVHTEKRDLQRALAADAKHLRELVDRIVVA